MSIPISFRLLVLSAALFAPRTVAAQEVLAMATPAPAATPFATARATTTLRDEALRAPGLRILVSLDDRRLWLMHGRVTLYTAPVAVGKEVIMEYEGRTWDFTTPRGRRTVIGKERNPMWSPPDWHYVELAVMQGWKLVWLQRGQRVPVPEGGYVTVRGNRVGRVAPDGGWHPVAQGDEAVFGNTLYAPPSGTINRSMPGILGGYKLDTGGGIYLHGTPQQESVGRPATHGCMRLFDGDLAYIYRMAPVGTPVYVY